MTRTISQLSGILFGIITVFHLLGLHFEYENWTTFSKPLLMPVLAGYYLANSIHQPITFRLLVIVILSFSLAGDSFLLALRLQPAKDWLFLLGLGAFLIAHLGYILAFRKLGGNGLVHQKWVLLPLAFYLGGLLFYLWPSLPGDLRIPVTVYGSVITLMALAAIHYTTELGWGISKMIIVGALLFIISDSMIALSSFVWGNDLSLWIMSTYIGAQWCLVKGLSNTMLPS